jgi:glutathione S-transferase
MKLHFSPTSPFVRKVMVAAHEKGLADRIDLTSPETMTTGELRADNPLEKVPCLVDDDGRALYDSHVIVDYLDSIGSGPALTPSEPKARLAVLLRHALADGLMDAGVACIGEMRRPEDLRWADSVERQKGKMARALDALEGQAADMGDTVDLGTLSVGCALGYVDLRYGDMNWREGRPKLAAWYEAFSRRPSMVKTAPPAA